MEEKDFIDSEITEDNWIQYGPHMELSVLSFFPYPAEWRPKIVNNKRIKPKIPEADMLKNKVDYIKKIYTELKNEFHEIEFKNNLTNESIELLCNEKEEDIFIDVNITLGIKRFGRIKFKLYGEYTKYLNTKIYFIDEDEHRCREEINSMMDRLIKVTNAFCGTIGLETDVWNIFKLDDLPLSLPMYFNGKNTYGIEKIYWKG